MWSQNCLQCPLVNTQLSISVNNIEIKPNLNCKSPNLNCKSRNTFYLWQCKLCYEENSYFGRTIQRVHERTNTHTVNPRFSPLPSIKTPSDKPPCQSSLFTISPLPSNMPLWGLIEFNLKVETKQYLNRSPRR